MEEIVKSLEQLEGKGSFCGLRVISADQLKLEIKGFGLLKWPLTKRAVKGLIELAKPAKFGWRDKTLLDKAVRHAWEISKSFIKMDQKFLNETLNAVLDEFKSDLGLSEDAVLKAELHNLLIYEKGQFFSPHQDSEKSDGMVASLVMVLPSEHRGGSLIIDHHDTKKEFKSERFPLDKLSLIAFYVDCHHEVTAVKAGYRVTLTYNLMLENNPKKAKPSDIALKTKHEENISLYLKKYFANNDSAKKTEFYTEPPKWVYLLDHSYTQKGLSWKHLKNADRLRAEALKKAAETLDLEITMALADVQETWDCQGEYDGYGYHDYDDEDTSEDDLECNEIINSETVLKHWIDAAGNPLNYGEYFVSDKFICWTKATDEFKPFDSEYEGFMGNYGNTMDRWYHRAAIILWQKKDHYPVLFDIDANSVITDLYKLSKKTDQERKVLDILKSLLPYWAQKFRDQEEASLIKKIFELALTVNNAVLAKGMINHFNIKILLPETTHLFIALCQLYGNSWAIDIFNAWISSKKHCWADEAKIQKISEIVKIFSDHKDSHELTDWLLAYQLDKIKNGDGISQKNSSRVEILKSVPKRMNTLMELCQACRICQQIKIHLSAIDHIIQYVELYPPITLVATIQDLQRKQKKQQKMKEDENKKWEYQKLHQHIIEHLTAEKDRGLRQIDDWSITENIACTCKDCGVLKEFLCSRNSVTLTWPLAQNRRAHIHQKIDGLGISVTHQTVHIGSPHKLILTKTNELHRLAKQRFQEIEKALKLIS